MSELKPLFEPKSIAIIGASSKTGKTGNIILRGILDHGYRGKVYPINPHEDDIYGLKAYPSIKYVPGTVDLAIISIPAPAVLGVIEECAEKAVKFGVIISAGFGEASDRGAELERQIVEIAKSRGMRLLGPNSIGIVNSSKNLVITIAPFETWREGTISIIAQTGVFAGAVAHWVMQTQYFGIGKSVSLGNKCDLDEADILEHLWRDSNTRVVGVYLEGIRDGRKLMNIASNATKQKPVILVKSGRTEAGSKAAASHTGSMSGNDALSDAAFKQCGIIRVENFEELMDLLKAFDYQPLPKGNRVGILTLSGASGVLATDICTKLGLSIPKLSEETKKRIETTIMPSWQPASNPVDIWIALGSGAELAHKTALNALLEDENVDCVLAILLALSPAAFNIKKVFQKAHEKHPNKPIVVSIIGGKMAIQWFKKLEKIRIPAYLTTASPERAAKVLHAMYRYKQYLERSERIITKASL
ncbi:MAG: acetate--CoA ligase family protein [Candidatus Heimdallarchaeota archaeon]